MELKHLQWQDRAHHPEIQKGIDESFQYISSQTNGSEWGLRNGAKHYRLVEDNDYFFLERYVLKAIKKGQKSFVFMDIGAGNFQWGRGVAEYFQTANLPPDVTIKVYSVRGEKSATGEEETRQIGPCTLYEYGAFKVEDPLHAFAEKKQDLRNRCDVIVSSYCFLHLFDPIGTLLQTQELLHPNGLMVCDGFDFMTRSTMSPKNKMIKLLSDMKTPFLIRHSLSSPATCCFIMENTEEKPAVSLNYEGCEPHPKSDRLMALYGAAPWGKAPEEMRKQGDYELFSHTGKILHETLMDMSDVLEKNNADFALLLQTQGEKRASLEKHIHCRLMCLVDLSPEKAAASVNHMLNRDKEAALKILNTLLPLKEKLTDWPTRRSLLHLAASRCDKHNPQLPAYVQLMQTLRNIASENIKQEAAPTLEVRDEQLASYSPSTFSGKVQEKNEEQNRTGSL